MLGRHLAMSQSDPRPYFSGYHNGKSAVWVREGALAAGVHGWSLTDPVTPEHRTVLAGPSVLHYHLASRPSFRREYLDITESPTLPGRRPFGPSPAEQAALDMIRLLRREDAEPNTVARHIDELHGRLTGFSSDAVELLEEACLVMTPSLVHTLHVGTDQDRH